MSVSKPTPTPAALLTRATDALAVGDASGARTAALVAIAAALVALLEEEA